MLSECGFSAQDNSSTEESLALTVGCSGHLLGPVSHFWSGAKNTMYAVIVCSGSSAPSTVQVFCVCVCVRSITMRRTLDVCCVCICTQCAGTAV